MDMVLAVMIIGFIRLMLPFALLVILGTLIRRHKPALF